jgi:hypothetical protein
MGLYDRQTSLKMSEAEELSWRQAAAANGMPLQTWMRVTLDYAAGCGQLAEQLTAAAGAQRVEHAALMRDAKALGGPTKAQGGRRR